MSHEWRDQAACLGVDTEIFFPHKLEKTGIQKALAFCESCPVRRECLEDALKVEPLFDRGIRGGLLESERKAMPRDMPKEKLLPAPGRRQAGRICSVKDCTRPHIARGFCQKHYSRWRWGEGLVSKSGSPVCIEDGCSEPSFRQSRCKPHHNMKRREWDSARRERKRAERKAK